MTLGWEPGTGARIDKRAEEGESTKGVKSIKNVGDNTSWFRGTPYYWAEASLPLAYAAACVELVSKKLRKAWGTLQFT